MPIYEYECLTEGRRFEVFQKMSDDPVATCPKCGGAVKKLVSATAFQLKGGGWYKDGYSSTASTSKPVESAAKSEPAKASEPTKTEPKKE